MEMRSSSRAEATERSQSERKEAARQRLISGEEGDFDDDDGIAGIEEGSGGVGGGGGGW